MDRKPCFGILDEVFPVGEKGLREIVPDCFNCEDRLPCLKEAISTKDGIVMRSDALHRSSNNGFIGRIKKWSHMKELSRETEQREKRRK